MAKKKISKKPVSRRSQYADLPSMNTSSRTMNEDQYNENQYMDIIREFISSPTVKYVAGGIATALLTRLATKLSDKYPELSTFIRENLDQFEGKMSDFRSNNTDSARH